ncbi:hypothetical protein [Providencia huashanensis]|uniref:hypothetical protein n=1 Tax=Providencia huashanensis TaxID=3037798 RepID=UPI004045B841
MNRDALSFTDDYNMVMERLNYLAKDYSKHYSSYYRTIGHSQYKDLLRRVAQTICLLKQHSPLL